MSEKLEKSDFGNELQEINLLSTIRVPRDLG